MLMSNISNLKTLRTLKQLEALIEDSRQLTAKEYLSLLEQIKKNFTIRLAIASITDVMAQSMSYLSIIEKVHYLVDSAEVKAKVEEIQAGGTETATVIGYKVSEDDKALEELFNTDVDA
jgi:hypothetical protein